MLAIILLWHSMHRVLLASATFYSALIASRGPMASMPVYTFTFHRPMWFLPRLVVVAFWPYSCSSGNIFTTFFFRYSVTVVILDCAEAN